MAKKPQPNIKATDLGAAANVGDKVKFDNTLVRGTGIVEKVAANDAYFKANGDKFRYVIKLPNGTIQLCSSSEIKVIQEGE